MKIITKSYSRGVKINQPQTINITRTSISSAASTQFLTPKEYIALVNIPRGLAIAISLVKKDGFSKVGLTGAKKYQATVAHFNPSTNDGTLYPFVGKYTVIDIINHEGLNCILIKKKDL